MKQADDKYFIYFPEFFNRKPWGIEVYASTSVQIMEILKGINIIFINNNNLELIKQEAFKDWEKIANLEIETHLKQTCLNIARSLKHKKPVKPKIKILFKEGEPGTCEISDDEKILTIYISGIKPPPPEEETIWFFPSDVFEKAYS